MAPGGRADLPETVVEKSRSGSWAVLTGRYLGQAFRAVVRDRPGVSLVELLREGGVHDDTSLEDACLALAARDGDNSLRCHYLADGTHVHDYPSDQPPLVLLHALAGNLHTWSPLIPALRHHYRVVLVDLPGHGRSDVALSGGAADLRDELVAWFATVASELDLREFHLVGHSLGGRVAAYVARQSPEHVSSLTLVAPALRPALSGVRAATARAASVLSIVRQPRAMRLVAGFVFFDMLVSHTRSNRRLVDYARQDTLRDQGRLRYRGVRLALTWLRESPTDADIDWADLASQVPTTALFGGQDRYCPASSHPSLSAAGVRVVQIADAGHLLPLEAPDEVLAALGCVPESSGT